MASPVRLHVSHDYWSNEDELQFIKYLGSWSKLARPSDPIQDLLRQKHLLESYILTIQERVVLGSIQPLTCLKVAKSHLIIVENQLREIEAQKKKE